MILMFYSNTEQQLQMQSKIASIKVKLDIQANSGIYNSLRLIYIVKQHEVQ